MIRSSPDAKHRPPFSLQTSPSGSSMETTQKIHARVVHPRLPACENGIRRKYQKCQERPHRKPQQTPPPKRAKHRQPSRLPPTTKLPYGPTTSISSVRARPEIPSRTGNRPSRSSSPKPPSRSPALASPRSFLSLPKRKQDIDLLGQARSAAIPLARRSNPI